jgi:hypothetical protein
MCRQILLAGIAAVAVSGRSNRKPTADAKSYPSAPHYYGSDG